MRDTMAMFYRAKISKAEFKPFKTEFRNHNEKSF